MSETAKPVKVSKPRKPAEHPKYEAMIITAIAALKERNGSSRQAIVKHVTANNKVDPDKANSHVKIGLKRMTAKNALIQTKGTGASGSFKINKAAIEKPKPKVKKVVTAKKPAAKKPKKAAAKPKTKKVIKKKVASPKKATKKSKKPAVKKSPSKPKKAVKKLTPKKPAAKKSPAKAKSKAKKTGAKKAAKKK